MKIIVCILLLAGLCFLVNAKESEPTLVQVAKVQHKLAQPTIWRFGSLVTLRDSQIAARVQGQLVWMLEKGQTVSANQVIAKLDDSLFLLSKQKKQAQIKKIQANLHYLNNEVKRLSSLVKSQSSSKTHLEQTESLAQAEQAELQAQQADLEAIKQRIEYCKIRAPFDGMLVERLVELGEVVAIGDPVSRLVDTFYKDIKVMVPLSTWQHLAIGNRLTVKSGRNHEQLSIRQIIPVGQSNSQMMEVLLNANALPWPVGIDAEVAVPQGESQLSLVVPRDALVIRQNNTLIYKVATDNSVQQVNVQVGATLGDDVIVTGDLSLGDQVVTRGAERLLPNAKVKLMADAQINQSGQSNTEQSNAAG